MISPPAVDVHAHFVPPSYRAALKRAEIDPPPLIHAAAKALPETDLLDDNQKRGMFTATPSR